MKGLLVRVGADQSEGGGHWNGLVNSRTGEFVYVPIPETGMIYPQFEKPYSLVTPALERFGFSLPDNLAGNKMHLDPDFSHLSYGDQGQRAAQILAKLGEGDLLVFYAGLRDVHPQPRLVYAIIGLYVVDRIEKASSVLAALQDANAHTRRVLSPSSTDIVIRAKPAISGRLERCLPIGSFRTPAGQPQKNPSYRVESNLLETWGGLSIADGFLQRSARLPDFSDANRFYEWFKKQRVLLLQQNN
jgi:hypothetical protein